MSQVVLGVGVPHTPMFPQQVKQAQGPTETARLYREVRTRLDAAAPDLILSLASDHLCNFFMDSMPAFAVGVVDQADGPHESRQIMPWYTVPCDRGVGRELLEFGLDTGFDLAGCEEVRLDHATLVPLHFLTPRMDIPVVPFFVKGLVTPLPRASRCYAVGRMLRRFVEELPGDRRVAVIASGSFSLEVGGPRRDWLDEAWVTTVMQALRDGKPQTLARRATEPRMLYAGNVGGELLNWMVLQGFVGGKPPAFLERQAGYGHAYGVWEVQA